MENRKNIHIQVFIKAIYKQNKDEITNSARVRDFTQLSIGTYLLARLL